MARSMEDHVREALGGFALQALNLQALNDQLKDQVEQLKAQLAEYQGAKAHDSKK